MIATILVISLIIIGYKYNWGQQYIKMLSFMYTNVATIVATCFFMIVSMLFAFYTSMDEMAEEPKLDPNINISDLDTDWKQWRFYAHHNDGHKYKYRLIEYSDLSRHFDLLDHAQDICFKCIEKSRKPISMGNGLYIYPDALKHSDNESSSIMGEFKDKDGNKCQWGVMPPPRNERSKIQLEYLEGD